MIGEIIGVFSTILGPIFAFSLIRWLVKPRHALRWIVLPPKSMMEIADEISDRLTTTFAGQVVTNLTKFAFILHNTGREPIDEQMVIDPITWKAPGTILHSRIVASRPPVKLKVAHSGNSIVLSWSLFNQECKALIEVICDSDIEENGGSLGNIEGQIRRIPEIKVRHIGHFDETEVRKRIKRNAAHVPTALRFLVAENLRVFILRHGAVGFAIGAAAYSGLGGFVVADSVLTSHTHWAAVTGAGVFSLVLAFCLYITWNPYARILRMPSS